MKNNRKNRKLNFIRQKNKIRQGLNDFVYFEKTTFEFMNDLKEKDKESDYFNNLLLKANEHLYKKFKIKFNFFVTQFMPYYQVDDDFVQNKYTHAVKLRLK
jgi:hypothetical protein